MIPSVVGSTYTNKLAMEHRYNILKKFPWYPYGIYNQSYILMFPYNLLSNKHDVFYLRNQDMNITSFQLLLSLNDVSKYF